MFYEMLLVTFAMEISIFYCDEENAFLTALLRGKGKEAKYLLEYGNLSAEQLGGEPWHETTPLIAAVHNYPYPFEDIALTLIGKGVHFGGRTRPHGNTVLHESVKRGMVTVVKALLSSERGKELLEVKNGEDFTALQSLVDDKVLDKVEKRLLLTLLDAGANVDAERDTFRPLHATASTWDADTAKLLLAKGADVNAKYVENGVPMTPLEYVLSFKEDKPAVRRCILAYVSYGADLSVELAEKILTSAKGMVSLGKNYDSFDEFFVDTTRVVEHFPSPYLSASVEFYDERGAFPLFRLCKTLWRKFPNRYGISELESRQSDILNKMDEGGHVAAPRKWEMKRVAWNMALAAYMQRDVTPRTVIRKIGGDSWQHLDLYVMRNSLTSEARSLQDEEIKREYLEPWEDVDSYRIPRRILGRHLIDRMSMFLGEPEERLWAYVYRKYCRRKTSLQNFLLLHAKPPAIVQKSRNICPERRN